MKFQQLIKTKILKIRCCFVVCLFVDVFVCLFVCCCCCFCGGVKLSDTFSILIHVKMSINVGILTFICVINSMISSVKHEKWFLTSGPGFKLY